MPVITLPYKFKPREYQLPFFRAMDGGCKRAVLLNHRRAGKDKSAFNFMVKEAFKRVGVYYYFFPTYNQGRKILWDGIDKDGFKFLDHVPKAIRDGDPNSTEMKLRLTNGSLIQIVGSDNIDSIVGTNPVGTIFSEYPLQDPKGWEFVRPILRENGGWAVFPYTPRGKNHGYDLYEVARNNPDWYCEKLTIDDTYGRGATVGPQDIQAEREAGMSENLIQQEYYCLSPTTRILRSDLTWITMADVKDGDELIGVDEDVTDEKRRKLRPSLVTKRWETTKQCFRLTMSDGTVVTASHEHPWLTKQRPSKARKEQTYKWVNTNELRVGRAIADTGLRPWKTDDSRDGGWLAGLYDGEGCVSRSTVQVSQKPGVVLTMAARVLTGLGHTFFATKGGGCVTYTAPSLSALRILGSLRPVRLLEKARSIWNGAVAARSSVTIVNIEDIGLQPVIGISTSTKTFIAEGLITHNCSFDAAVEYAVFGEQVFKAREEGRVCKVPHDSRIPVNCYWDIGRDGTAIWFIQKVRSEVRVIDYHIAFQSDITTDLTNLRNRPYLYETQWMPHDADYKNYSTGKTPKEIATELGFNVEIVPRLDKQSQITAARIFFARCWFDDEKTKPGFDALSSWHFGYDSKLRVNSALPVHNWASHAGDAFCQAAIAHEDEVVWKKEDRYSRKPKRNTSWMSA